MSRQLEAVREERQRKLDAAVLRAVDGGIVEAVGAAGADFAGLALSFDGESWLAVVKGNLAGRRQVAFVGAGDLPALLVKIEREARRDKLSWKEDKYGKK